MQGVQISALEDENDPAGQIAHVVGSVTMEFLAPSTAKYPAGQDTAPEQNGEEEGPIPNRPAGHTVQDVPIKLVDD